MPFAKIFSKPMSKNSRRFDDSTAAGGSVESSTIPTSKTWNKDLYKKEITCVNSFWVIFTNDKHGVVVLPQKEWSKEGGKMIQGQPVFPLDAKGPFIGTTFPDSINKETGEARHFFRNYTDAPTFDSCLTEE